MTLAPTARTAEETHGVGLGSFDTFAQDVAKRERHEKTLDDLISGSFDKGEASDRSRDFEAVNAFDKMARERYGRSAVDVVEESHHWAGRFRADPVNAQSEFVSHRMRDGVNAFHEFDDQKPAPASKSDEPEHSYVKLNRILENAIDEAEAMPQREAVYREFVEKAGGKLHDIFGAPGVSQADQLASLRDFVEASHRDPYVVGHKLASMNGAPVTQQDWQQVNAEVQRIQQENNLATDIQAMQDRGDLQHMDNAQVQEDMATLLQHPEFPRSGNAYQDVVLANQAAVYAAVERQTQAAVQKAQRAAPIATSGGHAVAPSRPEGGMDAAINAALERHGWA
jgi:hypothetical protein